MSRGPGRIERAIAAILDAEPDNAFTVADLCERVYRGISRIEKKHRVSVLRAASRLAKRRDILGAMQTEQLGGTLVYFNLDNVMSYGMAQLKADFLNSYRSSRAHPSNCKTEADLRAMLVDPSHRWWEHAGKLIQPGEAWWEFTQEAIAEIEARRSGDPKRVEEIEAKHAEARERRLAELAEKWASKG